MMTQINGLLASKGIYFLTLLLLLLGVYGMVSCKNYMKKLICMNIMQVAVIFFYLCFAQKKGGTIPVALDTIVNADNITINNVSEVKLTVTKNSEDNNNGSIETDKENNTDGKEQAKE